AAPHPGSARRARGYRSVWPHGSCCLILRTLRSTENGRKPQRYTTARNIVGNPLCDRGEPLRMKGSGMIDDEAAQLTFDDRPDDARDFVIDRRTWHYGLHSLNRPFSKR